jgi:hypothetical protein
MEHTGRGTLIAVYIRLTHGTRNTGTKIEKVTDQILKQKVENKLHGFKSNNRLGRDHPVSAL